MGQSDSQNFLVQSNLALIHLADAQSRRLASKDPLPELARVYERTDRALQLKPEAPAPCRSQAEAHLVAAGELLRHGGDVAPEVTAGLQALARRATYGRTDAVDETLRARLLLLRARWLSQKGKPARKAWKQADAAAVRAQKLDPAEPDARLTRAAIVRYQVELHAVQGSAAVRLVQEGLGAADQAVRQQPWNLFAQAAQASLWLLRGRVARPRAERLMWQHKGRAALAGLLRASPLLQLDYGSLSATR
jgi:hypothetical protein